MLQFVRVGMLTGAAVATAAGYLVAQSGASMPPVNQASNPYQTIENYFKLPAGRTWGSTSAVDIDKDGRTIWVAERCGANSCWDATKNEMSTARHGAAIRRVGQAGQELRRRHDGLPARHPRRSRRQRLGHRRQRQPAAPAPRRSPPTRRCRRAPAKVVGHQVFKFSPDGKLLLTLGKAGGNQPGQPTPIRRRSISRTTSSPIRTATSSSPKATATRHLDRALIRFDKTGKFLQRVRQARHRHRGRVHAAARAGLRLAGPPVRRRPRNNRIQILDAETLKTLDTWYQFSRLSGIFIDKNDMLYGADSESGSVNPPHGAWMRGIRIGSAKDGKVTAFIPDPTSVGETFSMVDGKPVMKKADGSPGADRHARRGRRRGGRRRQHLRR